MDSEQEHVARAARGDEDAFQLLWSRHRDAVYSFACWVLQDSAAAEDVVQECFLALLEHPSRFDPKRASLRTLLLGIARNQCRNRWRKLRSEVALENEGISHDAPALDRLTSDEANAILNAAVARLPALQREALYLLEFEDLDLDEAASIARVSAGTLKARLHRGRERLKRELAWLAKEGF